MSHHVMWDIESLDTRPSAIVLSVGAVCFDPNSDELGPSFHAILDLKTQAARGRTLSIDTIDWWNQQSIEARQVFAPAERIPVVDALHSLSFLLQEAEAVWGNGADFDNVIIGSLYESFDMRRAWSYGRNRCFRTVKSMALPKTYVAPVRAGVHHNALDDARYQAQVLQAIVRATGTRF
jgi:hypothetical protein